MKYFTRVLYYLRPYKTLASGSVVVIVLSGLAALLAPWPLKIILDNVLGDQPIPPLLARAFPFLPPGRTPLLWLAD